jgi:transposase
MEVVHARCAGLHVSKKDANVCVRIPGRGRGAVKETVTKWGSTTNQVLALCELLIDGRITLAALESTSDYWKAVLLPARGRRVRVMLVNAGQVKNLAEPLDRLRVSTLLLAQRFPTTEISVWMKVLVVGWFR